MGFVKAIAITDLKPEAGDMDIYGLPLAPIAAVGVHSDFINVIHDETCQALDCRIIAVDGEVIRADVDVRGRRVMTFPVFLKVSNQLWIDLLIFAELPAQYRYRPEFLDMIFG